MPMVAKGLKILNRKDILPGAVVNSFFRSACQMKGVVNIFINNQKMYVTWKLPINHVKIREL